jgi:hypothetical protein
LDYPKTKSILLMLGQQVLSRACGFTCDTGSSRILLSGTSSPDSPLCKDYTFAWRQKPCVQANWSQHNINSRETMNQSQKIQIKLKGKLQQTWSEWLDGMDIQHDQSGNTILSGSIPDQAALHGLLIRIRDLGIPLLEVKVEIEEA